METNDREASRGRLDWLEYESLLPLYEEAAAADPLDLSALFWLGHAFTRLGRIEEGLDVDLRLNALRPRDPTVRYNLACSYSLLGRPNEALNSLEEAVDLGYRDLEHMLRDPDLAALRDEQRYLRVVERLESEG